MKHGSPQVQLLEVFHVCEGFWGAKGFCGGAFRRTDALAAVPRRPRPPLEASRLLQCADMFQALDNVGGHSDYWGQGCCM
eukprot:scaffold227911_cov17-Tisochrysis_lutea.AAC.1